MADNDPNTLLLLGEIRGQLRELVHSSNNNGAKLDALAIRVTALEAEKNRRDGAMGVAEWLLKNWASVLGLLGVVVIGVFFVQGRLH